MSYLYLPNGGPDGQPARVQGYTHGTDYLGIYRQWPGSYAILWNPTGRVLATVRSQKGAEILANLITEQHKLYQRIPPDGGPDLTDLLAGWQRIYPNEVPARERKRPTRAGWVAEPYRVQDHKHPAGCWEIGGYTRGITGAVEDRTRYGMTIDLTHLPTGFLYGHADTWDLATILADTMATVLPGGGFGLAPPTEELAAAHTAVQAARTAYADQLSADRAA